MKYNKPSLRGKVKKPDELWELLKARIKKSSIDFSRSIASEDKLVIGELAEIVNDFEANLPLNQQQDELYEKTKVDLEEKLLERAKGLIFRSKVRWYEGGEKNTKYFFSLEKARYNAKTCYKLIDEKGNETTEVQDILNMQRDFYKELYEVDDFVHFNMRNTGSKSVPKSIYEQQSQELVLTDLAVATKSMNNGKTPGQDGIPVDFYKVFWNELKEPLINMVVCVYNKDILHSTAREGILNLIPKANKDTRLIKNLRPITLLNTDYKIIEKAVANKMIPALSEIISRDQRGFMKERRISVNIRKTVRYYGIC